MLLLGVAVAVVVMAVIMVVVVCLSVWFLVIANFVVQLQISN